MHYTGEHSKISGLESQKKQTYSNRFELPITSIVILKVISTLISSYRND